MKTLKTWKCMACGGDIILSDDGKSGECSFCHRKYEFGSSLTDDKSIIDYEQATEYWQTFKFADAKRKFLKVANSNPAFSEAWWGAFVSEYGIEFVTNKFGRQIPTCHRAHTVSVFEDENYKKAIETADAETKEKYRKLGEKIEDIRKGIIEKSNKGEFYDIFICFKATEINDDRRKTMDFDLGRDIYKTLSKKGYRVFFAPETLLQVTEQEYEPYIYRALSTAKVMLLLCSDNKEIESAWVKNEWSRFLDMHNGQGLIPICGNRYEPYSPNSLPEELRKLNAILFDIDLYDKINKKIRQFFVGRLLSDSQPAENNPEDRENYDESVIEIFEAGEDAFNNKDYKTAFALYWQAAQKHYAPAEYKVAECYEKEIGVEESIEDAVKWYQKSANQNYTPALLVLAEYYDNGNWVEKNEEEATNLYLQAAKNGDEDAMIELAERYDNGKGTAEDKKEAAKWYRKVAEKGNPAAQTFYGLLCSNGIGVQKNSEEAVKWFYKSAEQGYADGQYYYALCCCYGNGIEQNIREANLYFKKAAEQGHADATYMLSRFNNGSASRDLKKRARKLGSNYALDESQQKISRNTIIIPIISSVAALIIMLICAFTKLDWKLSQWLIGLSLSVILGTVYLTIIRVSDKIAKLDYIPIFIILLNMLLTAIFKPSYNVVNYWVKAITMAFCVYSIVLIRKQKKWGILWKYILEIILLIIPISLINLDFGWGVYQWVVSVVVTIVLLGLYGFLYSLEEAWVGIFTIPLAIASIILMIIFRDKYTIISYWVNGTTLFFSIQAIIISISDCEEGWTRFSIITSIFLILLILATAFNVTSFIFDFFSEIWNSIFAGAK